MGVRPTEAAADGAFDALYAAAYPRLVAVLGAVTQDRGEAEEAVQDAFVRLSGEWARVRRYDDPEAWVRRAAFGFVSNRRRKVRNGVRALSRLGANEFAPPADTQPVDVRRAIAALPRQQREVVVLRELGFTLPEVAAELGLPVGTVKSRLARARVALAGRLTGELEDEHV